MPDSNVREILSMDKAYEAFRASLSPERARVMPDTPLERWTFECGWRAAVDALIAAGQILEADREAGLERQP